jgi:hypothetical protein
MEMADLRLSGSQCSAPGIDTLLQRLSASPSNALMKTALRAKMDSRFNAG